MTVAKKPLTKAFFPLNVQLVPLNTDVFPMFALFQTATLTLVSLSLLCWMNLFYCRPMISLSLLWSCPSWLFVPVLPAHRLCWHGQSVGGFAPTVSVLRDERCPCFIVLGEGFCDLLHPRAKNQSHKPSPLGVVKLFTFAFLVLIERLLEEI